jgi:hypothetical protein
MRSLITDKYTDSRRHVADAEAWPIVVGGRWVAVNGICRINSWRVISVAVVVVWTISSPAGSAVVSIAIIWPTIINAVVWVMGLGISGRSDHAR